MNRLFLNRCYLCGPMDFAKDGGVEWRHKVQQELKDLEIIWLDPTCKPTEEAVEDLENRQLRVREKEAGHFDAVAALMSSIRKVDLRLVDLADFLIVHLDTDVYSVGTYNELFEADRQSKPIVIHMQQGKTHLPDWLFATIPHQMVFSTWNELCAYLRHVAHDPAVETFKRWKFLNYGRLYGMDRVELAGGRTVQVSPEDYKYLAKFAWHASKMRLGYYAYRKVQKRKGGYDSCAMHVEVARRMGLRPGCGLQVDHINHDTLDNRRENLRVVTPSQQTCNQRLRADNTTGVKGVSFVKRAGLYHAYVAIGGKRRFSKYFATLEEAEVAVKEARRQLHGEYACDGGR